MNLTRPTLPLLLVYLYLTMNCTTYYQLAWAFTSNDYSYCICYYDTDSPNESSDEEDNTTEGSRIDKIADTFLEARTPAKTPKKGTKAAKKTVKEETSSCSTVVVPFTQQTIDSVLHNTQTIMECVRQSAVNLGTLSARIRSVEERRTRFEIPVSDMTDGLDALQKVVEKYMARRGNASQSGVCRVNI